MWDVLGGTTKFFHDDKEQFVAAVIVRGCHSSDIPGVGRRPR